MPCLCSVTVIWHPSSAGDSDVDKAASGKHCGIFEGSGMIRRQNNVAITKVIQKSFLEKKNQLYRCLEVVCGLLHLAALAFTSPGLVMYKRGLLTWRHYVPSNLKVYSLLMGKQVGLFLCRNSSEECSISLSFVRGIVHAVCGPRVACQFSFWSSHWSLSNSRGWTASVSKTF
jgi:hypothetical protein